VNSVKIARTEGIEVVVPLVYSLSPVHTDEFYAQKTREMIERLKPDRVMIKDSIGLLTVDRTRTLVPVVKKLIGQLPFEMHSHCTTGLAPLCCLESVKLGVDTIHTCFLSSGERFFPSLDRNMSRNLRRLGYSPKIDDQAVENDIRPFPLCGQARRETDRSPRGIRRFSIRPPGARRND